MLDHASSTFGHRELISALLPRLPFTYFSCTFSASRMCSHSFEVYVLISVMITYMSHRVIP